MKKGKRSAAPQPDASRPTKPPAPSSGARARPRDAEVPVPKYAGPSKTRDAPAPLGGRGAAKAKPAFEREMVRRPRSGPPEADYGDQRRRRGRGAAGPAEQPEQYVRMRIRVRHGQLSVIDSHLVNGPLGQARGFPGSNAYEVTLGDRLLHAGALPDLGVQRSFVNPSGPPAQRGHHLTERSVYEFYARVPAHELTRDTIRQIAVRLHRVKEEARADRLGMAPLARQFEREVRSIAELVGLPDSVLPEAIEKRGGRTPNA